MQLIDYMDDWFCIERRVRVCNFASFSGLGVQFKLPSCADDKLRVPSSAALMLKCIPPQPMRHACGLRLYPRFNN